MKEHGQTSTRFSEKAQGKSKPITYFVRAEGGAVPHSSAYYSFLIPFSTEGTIGLEIVLQGPHQLVVKNVSGIVCQISFPSDMDPSGEMLTAAAAIFHDGALEIHIPKSLDKSTSEVIASVNQPVESGVGNLTDFLSAYDEAVKCGQIKVLTAEEAKDIYKDSQAAAEEIKSRIEKGLPPTP